MATFWLLRKIFGWLLEDSGYPRALKELWFLYPVNQEESDIQRGPWKDLHDSRKIFWGIKIHI